MTLHNASHAAVASHARLSRSFEERLHLYIKELPVSEAFKLRVARPTYPNAVLDAMSLYTSDLDDVVLRPRVQHSNDRMRPWKATARVDADNALSMCVRFFCTWRDALDWALRPTYQ